MRRLMIMILVFALSPVTSARAADTGFVNLPRLVATHPLHGILLQYDREIAALRNTQRVAGLRDPALSAAHAKASLETDAATAASRAAEIVGPDPSADLGRERKAIAAVLRVQHASGREFVTSTTQLVAETNANVRAYGGQMAERTQRAYAARRQAMSEKESALAYALARRDAGQRLMLRLKLDELHLSPVRRARLQAALAALNERERRAVDALRRTDAKDLAVYRAQLESAASEGEGAMAAQLRDKSEANYAILQRAFNEQAGAVGAFPLTPQLGNLSRTFAASSSVQSIAAGMRSVARDATQRFSDAAASDAQSQRDVAEQIASLQSARAALYRSIVEQVNSAAQLVAREHHLSAVALQRDRARPGGVDLTPAVASRIAQSF